MNQVDIKANLDSITALGAADDVDAFHKMLMKQLVVCLNGLNAVAFASRGTEPIDMRRIAGKAITDAGLLYEQAKTGVAQ
jgi:hypothetical protein